MIVERSRAGDQYGLAIAISGMNPADGAVLTADGETKIAALETSALKGAINQDAELARELLVYFARKAAERHIGLIAPEASARQRIHAALLDWAEVHKGQWRIAKMPKHRELAERARVDESQTAAAIAALIASGVARRDYPGLAITDIDELRRLAS
ncbi:MAG: hypothetical protein GC152_02605 [Alphaproteobacteria bacterium]|nr:hypothetical protein [Alphaproteobacteria bacterium]